MANHSARSVQRSGHVVPPAWRPYKFIDKRGNKRMGYRRILVSVQEQAAMEAMMLGDEIEAGAHAHPRTTALHVGVGRAFARHYVYDVLSLDINVYDVPRRGAVIKL